MKTSTDKNLNPRLAKEVQGVRSILVGAAEQSPLPDRFTTTPHPDEPAMIFHDSVTGKDITVPLFGYRVVRDFLTELFDEV